MFKFLELAIYHLRLLGAVLDRLMMMMMMVMMGSCYQAMLQEELMNSLEQEYSTI